MPGLFILVFLFQEKILLERSEHLTKDASKIKANIKIVIEVCFCGFFFKFQIVVVYFVIQISGEYYVLYDAFNLNTGSEGNTTHRRRDEETSQGSVLKTQRLGWLDDFWQRKITRKLNEPNLEFFWKEQSQACERLATLSCALVYIKCGTPD